MLQRRVRGRRVRIVRITRSCPITKVCFTCGMKEHIKANCPNRRSGCAMMSSRDQECDRCFSSFHKTNNAQHGGAYTNTSPRPSDMSLWRGV
ncbi:hypothetical protein BJ165DRAFT_121924 [Panaeolus papilionaceus]|nr:hypothetical protein BJ165DRAFT_121924 [Panaeolus papilionaceus]